jgi:hypothetical protein
MSKKRDYSAQGRRSKRKGKTYERRVAKILKEFTSVEFRSTPSSGGFNKFGGATIREELFCGDVIADDATFRYCVEAKNREEFSFTSILKSPETAAFTRWWHQCVEDANTVGLEPLMFFKPNRADDFVVMTLTEYNKHYGNPKVPFYAIHAYINPITIKPEKDLEITVKLPVPVMIDWKAFIKHHDPKSMFRG